MDFQTPALIPKPVETQVRDGVFRLRKETAIEVADGRSEAVFVAEYLANALRATTGFELPVARSASSANAIRLEIADIGADWGEEGYELTVLPDVAVLRAAAVKGLIMGIQTIRQLLPEDAFIGGRPGECGAWPLPCLRIRDKPRYRLRGFMLDCSRRFLSLDFIKRSIDMGVYLKMNVLHWHFVDNEGWRPEIRRYPRLTEIGAFVGDDPTRHGSYSQEEMKEIVAYARARHVMVIPEVEIPGHTFAAMLAYPDLCCTGKPIHNPGHSKDLYCAGNDKVFEFLENVFGELTGIFPAPFFHVGGDEAPKERWKACPRCQERIRAEGLSGEAELQGYVCQRAGLILKRMGKRLIGWEEILDGARRLPQDAIVHWWRRRTLGDKYAVEAARAGFDVVASPNSNVYLSFPVNPGGVYAKDRTIDLTQAYLADYTPEGLGAQERDRLLGAWYCVWTTFVKQEEIEAAIYPRALAVAERLWSPAVVRDFDDFHTRLKQHYCRLDAMGIRHGAAFRTRCAQDESPAANAREAGKLDG